MTDTNRTTETVGGHTPGPWTVEDPFDHELVIVQDGKASHEWQFIATIPHGDKDGDPDDIPDVIAERNARLIAAAPDLLAALKRLLAAQYPGTENHHETGCRCFIHEAQTAIAKAEGR